MKKKILILGATGNFGSNIAKALAKANIPIIIAGRQKPALMALQHEIDTLNLGSSIEIAVFDIKKQMAQQLALLKPFLVINTCGPFQHSDYATALDCIHFGIHYVDLADGRDFVNGIHDALDNVAKDNHCLVISGASTVPCLSSAVLAHYKNEFTRIDSLTFGITPGQKTPRGLATTQAILSYVGKPLKPIPGALNTRYGWQDLYCQTYPLLGKRWMSNCDIPDLDLLPKHYGISHIRFSAGIESAFLHLGLWILSGCVRLGLPIRLDAHADVLLKVSHWFDRFGSDNGGMHMIFSGKDRHGREKVIKWFLVAQNGYGVHVPTIPAIVLVKHLISGKLRQTGAIPCVGLISLEEYLVELGDENIRVYAYLE